MTNDQAEKQLAEQNRDYYNRKTWDTLLNTNTMSAIKAENQLVKQYTEDTADAYVSYLKNKNTIENSGIVGSGKADILAESQSALEDAFNSYRSNLQQNISAIQESAAKNEQAILAERAAQAEMTAAYNNLHYDYLTELYNQYLEGENTLFNEKNWSKYLTYDQLKDEQGNLMYDDEGNPIYSDEARLKTADELSNVAYEEFTDENGNVTKEYTSFYDENGNLTVAGIDFFDQMENALANEGGYSWDDFLSENNQEVYDWSRSYNPYDFTYEGSNAGTFRTMNGRMSTDYLYDFAERFGGFTSGQIKEMYSDYEQKSQDLANAIAKKGKDKGKGYINEIRGLTDSLQDMAVELGIDADLQEEMGMTWEQLDDYLNSYLQQAKSSGQMAADWFAKFLGDTGAGALAGAAIGGVVGTVAAPITSTVGAIAGAIAGGVAGIVDASMQTDNQRNLNKQVAEASKKMYDEVLYSMINYSMQKRRMASGNLNIPV